jgi:formate dehydrogenase subunit gamma
MQAPAQQEDATVDAVVARALAAHRERPGALLPLLHAVQQELGWIPGAAVVAIAAGLNLAQAEVQGVLGYYPDLRGAPRGRHLVQLCRAESCLACGGDALLESATREFGCGLHATRADGALTLEPVYCLGLCAASPALLVDGEPHARVDAAALHAIAAALELPR